MKILFIDTWSKGSFFTSPVAKLAKSKDSIVGFLHANKLYNVDDINWKEEIYDFSFDCADFNNSLVSALKNINPDAVVFISMHGMFQRWANYICSKLDIPCYFFMHGVRFNTKEIGRLKRRNIFELFRRVHFYNKHWFLLIRDCLKLTSIFKLPWRLFILSYLEMIFMNKRFSFSPKYKWGIEYKKVCINSFHDEAFFKEFTGEVGSDRFVVSGNITSRRAAIDSFTFDRANLNSILFISQPLAADGYLDFQSYIDSIVALDHFIKINDLGKFIVRLHPRDDKRTIQVLSKFNISMSKHKSLAKDLSSSCLVVGFNSSALLGCLEVGIPVLGYKFDNVPLLDSLKGSSLYKECNLLTKDSSDEVRQLIETGKKRRGLPKDLAPTENIVFNEILSSFNRK